MSARLIIAIKTLLFANFIISCNSELTKNEVELYPISSIKQYEEPPPPLPPDSTYPTLEVWLDNLQLSSHPDTTEKIAIFRIADTKNNHFLVLGYFDYTSDYNQLVRQIQASPIAEHYHILIQDHQNNKNNQLVDSVINNLSLAIKKSNFLKNNRTIKKILLSDTESNGVIDLHEKAF